MLTGKKSSPSSPVGVESIHHHAIPQGSRGVHRSEKSGDPRNGLRNSAHKHYVLFTVGSCDAADAHRYGIPLSSPTASSRITGAHSDQSCTLHIIHKVRGQANEQSTTGGKDEGASHCLPRSILVSFHGKPLVDPVRLSSCHE